MHVKVGKRTFLDFIRITAPPPDPAGSTFYASDKRVWSLCYKQYIPKMETVLRRQTQL